MKNIHLLPTDKPSRLCFVVGIEESTFNLFEDEMDKGKRFFPQNIYITSDEEITGFENDIWVYNNGRVWLWQNTMALRSNNKPRKIILTTDQDLIGVQSIDDDFLEWFVKNPSCEEIEVKHFGTCCGNQLIAQCINCKQYNPVYKIIIPEEEPKQEKITAVEWFYFEMENLRVKAEITNMDGNDFIIAKVKLLQQAKEIEIKQREELYNETEVLQLLIKLKQTESFDNLYDWFNQNKKNNL